MAIITAHESKPFFTAVWCWLNATSAWADNTIESQTSTGTAFTIFSATANYLYLGHQSRFDLFTAILAMAGSVGTFTYAYYNGSSWIQFVPRLNYDFTVTGAEEWNVQQLVGWTSLAFSAGTPHATAPPDTDERYWIRISVSSVSTAPTVYQIQARPYAYYCTPTDVYSILQLDADFSSTTMPTRNMVEDSINAAQSIIDFKTYKTWRPTVKTEEHQEFNIAGMKLIERDVQRITKLEIWNGGGWDTKTEGRQSDYFLVPDIGMVYFSRYFLLPARIVSYRASVWPIGWGEFTFPVKITYIYGRDKYTDTRQFRNIWDITRKLAAIDVYQSADFSIITVSGSDRVTLDRKIENWREETELKLDELRRWLIF